MTGRGAHIAAGIALLCTAVAQGQVDDNPPGDLEECRQITEPLERLACYDDIGRAENRAEAPAPAAESQAAPATQDGGAAAAHETAGSEDQPAEFAVLTDEVGLEQPADEYKPIRVTIDSCGQANDRRFYFHFDNGQVWKYLGSKKLRYRSCATSAKLVEDGFGYTLQMDGDTAKHRVQRVK